MADFTLIQGAPCTWTQTATATNGAATATQAAPGATQCLYIAGVGYSASAAPATSVEVLVKSGATTLHAFQVPPSAFSAQEVNFPRPIRCAAGETASVTLPALGASVAGRVNIRGFTGTP